MQEQLTYEEAMRKLEELAQKMERSEIGIDEMAEKLKEAQLLLKYCKEKLYSADESIQKILSPEEK